MPMASLRFAVFAVSCALLASAAVWALPPAVFNVGDERGWAVPSSGNGTETYNHWAKRNRFQVGDILSFRYANDSVLLVSHDDYKQCSTDTPLSRFESGYTNFRLDGAGPFYFVSGVPGHCEAGQRMIARVRAPSSLTVAPAAAPGLPPSVSAGGAAAPSPAASSPAAPPSVVVGSGSTSTTPTPTPSPSPLPLPPASGASRRAALSIVSSVAVGLVVVGAVTLFAVV